MRKALALGLVFVMAMTAIFAIPASATGVHQFSAPACGCGADFEGQYGSNYAIDHSHGLTEVAHDCERITAYVSLKTWIYGSSYNNYTSRTVTDTDTVDYPGASGFAAVSKFANYQDTVYGVRGVESYHKVTIKCNGVERFAQGWDSSGDIPLAVVPPVVVQ
ncbi:MAG: hypothetical protein IJY86_11895 [Clostridia bacterium]|nr:hypothetical protein [Clostridia bacterium]